MKFSLARVDGRRIICSTQSEAKELDKSFGRIDVPTDHDGLKKFVQALFDSIHKLQKAQPEQEALQAPAPDPEEVAETPAVISAPVEKQRSYAELSVEIDNVFLNLPLAHQLTLASLALESARTAIPAPLVIKAAETVG